MKNFVLVLLINSEVSLLADGLYMISGNTWDSSKALSSDSTGYGCQLCIRNGWTYAVPDS